MQWTFEARTFSSLKETVVHPEKSGATLGVEKQVFRTLLGHGHKKSTQSRL
jgi:hypothetical protein